MDLYVIIGFKICKQLKFPLLSECLVNHSLQKVFKSVYHQTEFILGKMFAKSIEKCQITLHKRGSSTNIRLPTGLPHYLYKYLTTENKSVKKNKKISVAQIV